MKTQSKRILSSNDDFTMDPYSTTILDQLIENDTQWKSSDEIIKLTFKAMSDIIKIHGQSIKDIKSILTTRASKTQLTTGLSLKANVSDISQTIDQISTQIQQKLSYEDLNKILKQYLHRSQLAKALSERPVEKDQPKMSFKKYQDENKRLENFDLEMKVLQTRMNQFQKQVAKEISGCVTLNVFQEALNIIDSKVNSKDFNDTLDNFVTKQFLSQCLQKKANKNQIQPLLDSKADVQDLEYIVNSLESKVNLATLQKLTQVIQNKADKSDIMVIMNQRASLNKSQHRSMIDESTQKYENLKSQMASMICEVRQKLQSLSLSSSQEQTLSKKISSLSTQLHESIHLVKLQQSKSLSQVRIEATEGINSLKVQLKAVNEELLYRNNSKTDTLTRQLANEINLRKRCEQKIYEELDQVRKRVEEVTLKLFEKSQLLGLKSQLLAIIDRKVQKQQLNKAISNASLQIQSKFEKDNQTNTLLLQKLQKTYSQAISTNTSDIIKLSKSLSKKQEKFQFSVFEQSLRKCRKQVEDCRKTVDKSYEELQLKLSVAQYETDLIEIKKRFDKIFKQMELKANIKDVCVLVDSKPNIDDVNNALKEINEALNQKIAESQLQNILKDQSAINQTLCSENIVGRWMWQSGDLKPGNLIPWQIQSANTVPQHFFWQKDKTSILILAPGIYEVKAFNFLSSQTAKIQIYFSKETKMLTHRIPLSSRLCSKTRKNQRVTPSVEINYNIMQCYQQGAESVAAVSGSLVKDFSISDVSETKYPTNQVIKE